MIKALPCAVFNECYLDNKNRKLSSTYTQARGSLSALGSMLLASSHSYSSTAMTNQAQY